MSCSFMFYVFFFSVSEFPFEKRSWFKHGAWSMEDTHRGTVQHIKHLTIDQVHCKV